jgi:hypothetical protein
MKIIIPSLAMAISLAVFACTESSPSSPSDEGGSSSGGNPSSSSDIDVESTACRYSGEEYGISGLFACVETPGLQENKDECEEDDGVWVDACPSGEKATCISDEKVGEILKIYVEDAVCSDFKAVNVDGSEDNVPKGGACGPSMPYEDLQVSMCLESSEISTSYMKLACVSLDAPFVNECPSGEKATCMSDEQEEGIIKIYDDFVCSDFGWQNAEGSEDNVPKGGACGPISTNPLYSYCTEFPKFSIGFINIVCQEAEAPFTNECPAADLKCLQYREGIEIIYHLYGELIRSHTCEELGTGTTI